jgi:hypothetical protein
MRGHANGATQGEPPNLNLLGSASLQTLLLYQQFANYIGVSGKGSSLRPLFLRQHPTIAF